MRSLFVSCTLFATLVLPAQTRVSIGGTPTNLSADWSRIVFAPDPLQLDAFLALMPLSEVSVGGGGFAVIDSDFYMDSMYGVGNWLRCTLTATDYAYISDMPCAHLAGPGYAAPQALLTSDYDYGPYTGVAGTPYSPFPNGTRFGGNFQSFLNGQGLPSFHRERWQLRTRGWNPTDLWNGCGANVNITANFSGFLLARFTFAFH